MGRLLIDPSLPEGPKFIGAPELAFSLHVKALCYCARALTDGFVPTSKVYGLVNASRGQVQMAIKHLSTTQPGCGNPSWEVRADGWFLHDYDDPIYMNPMRNEVQELTQKRRIAAQKGGLTSVQNRIKKYGTAQPVKSEPPAPVVSSGPEANPEAASEALASTAPEARASRLASQPVKPPPKQTPKHVDEAPPPKSVEPSPPSNTLTPSVLGDRDTSSLSGDDVVNTPANGAAGSWSHVSQVVLIGHVGAWFLKWKGWNDVKGKTRADLDADAKALVELGIPGDDLHEILDGLGVTRDVDEVNRLSYFWQLVQDAQSARLKTTARPQTRDSGPTKLGESLPHIQPPKDSKS